MSTTAIRAPRRASRLRETHIGGLTQAAWLYWAAVVVPAAVGIFVAADHVHAVDWRRFVTLAVMASLSQLLSFPLNRRRVFHPAIVFIVAGALLLPPELMILLIVITCVPDWVKQRYNWYIQTFNIANYVVSGVAAWAVAQAIGFPASAGREAVAGACAAVVFVVGEPAPAAADALSRPRSDAAQDRPARRGGRDDRARPRSHGRAGRRLVGLTACVSPRLLSRRSS